ncbi:uncharacterized protein METZ01_LOCUS3833 [marine metagenome]|uniref:Uncharacterized protein n=1 Tax=marine metagenome TaxID=408172 RepID=A0A381N947_9ZZZZ
MSLQCVVFRLNIVPDTPVTLSEAEGLPRWCLVDPSSASGTPQDDSSGSRPAGLRKWD